MIGMLFCFAERRDRGIEEFARKHALSVHLKGAVIYSVYVSDCFKRLTLCHVNGCAVNKSLLMAV